MLTGDLSRQRLVSFFLRIGLAVVFIYAAIASFMDPDTWASFIPSFMDRMIPLKALLMIFSVYELVLAALLLWDRYVFTTAILSALTMLGIVIMNAPGMDVVFRDVAIMFMALALAALKK
ncbi:MAG: hypothetical protein A2751_00665 [Candidatus Doudnabacteria bacterium RIFCSPHIGHO2_01_FULL_46_14]|uniref:DoxX family protein n=1 Tax=Candidatus Doudnabacteria bacterium RIFCSPHIGHO2_01_FULL_46_14 TaxID=1817824 RepID=A0A1F5NMQ6_9BACT|nr:MAG: hypothetical protein A2751_00665 [Candidatus Doudnabacteria bacterium RIFCSPHIGHO2_01_FULL_46_14]